MARGRNNPKNETPNVENDGMENIPTETVSTETPAPAEAVTETAQEATVSETTTTPSADTKAELTDEQIAGLAQPFTEAVTAAASERDESTGDPTTEQIASINAVYGKLDGGVKVKNAAKKSLNDLMKSAMKAKDITLARFYMEVGEQLTSTAAKGATKAREPKAPVNPTEAFVERVAALNLAYNLAVASPVEAVDENWLDTASAAVANVDTAAVEEYRTWLLSDVEDKGDAPESATSLIVAAVKLSLGKAAKPGKAVKRTTSGDGPTYDGPRRDIAKHIAEAFADKAEGEFLKIGDIRKFKSEEYAGDMPSAGAISIRLFPKSGNCTLDGVTGGTDSEGNKGGIKTA